MKILNFSQFKKVAQPPKILTRPGQEKWYGLWIRKISIIFSFFIFKTMPFVSPNMVTSFMIMWGLMSLSAILLPGLLGILSFFWGLQFWTTLDSIDGELARAKKQYSNAGTLLDGIAHILLHLIFVAIGLKSFLLTKNLIFLYLGFINTILMLIHSNIYQVGKFEIKDKFNTIDRKGYKNILILRIASELLGHIEISMISSLVLLIFIFEPSQLLLLSFFYVYAILIICSILWLIYKNYFRLIKN